MVERVARGRIVVPAVAALTFMAAGMIEPEPAIAASRDTTLQIRVRVVEPCRIRVTPSGAVEHGCGSEGSRTRSPVSVRLSDLVERFEATPRQRLERPERSPMQGQFARAARPSGLPIPFTVSDTAPSARLVAANRRASDIAQRIGRRVRHITVAY